MEEGTDQVETVGNVVKALNKCNDTQSAFINTKVNKRSPNMFTVIDVVSEESVNVNNPEMVAQKPANTFKQDLEDKVPEASLIVSRKDNLSKQYVELANVRLLQQDSLNFREDQKRNASNASIVEKVCDSLILTADEELDAEELLPAEKTAVKYKKSSAFNDSKRVEIKKIQDAMTENSSLVPNQDIKKDEAATNADSTFPSDQMDPNEDVLKRTVSAKETYSTSNSRTIWISNVTQTVRASDLKEYLSKIGKVATAKVVTDGKKCYGYVVMDNPYDANESLKTLNNTYFGGRKIFLSFTRPHKGIPDKNEDLHISESDKSKLIKKREIRDNSSNDTDDKKVINANFGKSCLKRVSRHDPLTTKYEVKRRSRSNQRSRSRTQREYFRKEEEREYFKRKLLEEQRRNRDEMLRQIHREEKHREIEFRLEQERRKLQLERELFERERRELTRLDAERRKIERERLEVLRQRSKLQEEIHKSRMKVKVDDFMAEKRKDIMDQCKKPSSLKQPFQKSTKDDSCLARKTCNLRSSVTVASSDRQKTDGAGFHMHQPKINSKGLKSYSDRVAPPPPKLSDDYDGSMSKEKHKLLDYSDIVKPEFMERRAERGHKIDVIDRKLCSERFGDNQERKQERFYRKPDFTEQKSHIFSERKYDCGHDTKKYREDICSERNGNAQRVHWPSTLAAYNDPWKTTASAPISCTLSTRCQENNYPTSSYGGPPRISSSYYYNSTSSEEYPRYEHCSPVNGRKCN